MIVWSTQVCSEKWFVIGQAEFSATYPQEAWSYLRHGFMIQESDGTLIFVDQPDACIQLVGRNTDP